MFTHSSRLEHLLAPEHYFSRQQHENELLHLFAPAWHPAAIVRQLARPGDFVTLELLGKPILLRNFQGEVRAFLNICPHRHSKLTDLPHGNTERLRCQYHGWEFTADGTTGQIPDARSFKPWDRENSCLSRFRVEACGDVLFVSLQEEGPSLRDWLGPLWDRWAPSFGQPYQYSHSWGREFPCNWKVVLENSLESYHIPQVHPKTFKDYPEEANSWHELTPNYSTLRTHQPADFVSHIQNWIVRRLGQPVTMEYWHHARHPHITFASLDVHRMLMCVFPTSPTTCYYRTFVFTLRGHRRNPLAWALSRLLRQIISNVSMKVFEEDASIYQSVQRGLEASPHRGVIGTREERIHAFQHHVQEHCKPAKAARFHKELL
jgi:phenylpropionate dioxygenase-like ring-hydroxylating dioxygenase large terminal subunit